MSRSLTPDLFVQVGVSSLVLERAPSARQEGFSIGALIGNTRFSLDGCREFELMQAVVCMHIPYVLSHDLGRSESASMVVCDNLHDLSL